MNEELIKKLVGGGKTPEEVIAIAKEHGKEVTLEQAQAILDRVKRPQVRSSELPDDELDAVTGGMTIEDVYGSGWLDGYGTCENCHDPNKPTNVYNVYVNYRCYFPHYCDDCARDLGLL